MSAVEIVTPVSAPEGDAAVEAPQGPFPVAPELRLDDQLCFALYSAATEIVRAYRPLLAELGLTYPQYLVMMALWARDDQTVSDVARTLHQPAQGLLPVLSRLVGAGLVTRNPDPDDRRATRLTLTPAGATLEQTAALVQQRVACQTLLTPDGLADLRARLQGLVADLRGSGDQSPGAPA
jgi:DNA-binding MarR family transcriptional regulator